MSEVIKYLDNEIQVDWIREKYANLFPDPEVCEMKVQEKIEEQKREIKRLHHKYVENEGYNLTFYKNEHHIFNEAFNLKLSDAEAVEIVKKLTRHFKLKFGSVRFYGAKQSGRCGWWTAELRLSHNPSLGLVCHEVAHLAERRHCKKLMKVMGKLIKYCEKMNCWRGEEEQWFH